jgi:mRNA interferase MazF
MPPSNKDVHLLHNNLIRVNVKKDKKRLINFVSALLPERVEKVEKALLIHLDIK